MLAESTIRRKIHRACKNQPGDPEVVSENWGVDFNETTGRWEHVSCANKCMCPMGAVLLYYQPEFNEEKSIEWHAAKALNVPEEFVYFFVSRFDSPKVPDTALSKPESQLGAKVGRSLHKQYVK